MKPKCILKTAIGEAPRTSSLLTELKILLDPPRPLGGDIKSLASAFGYTLNEILYLTSRPHASPTEDLLRYQGHVSIEVLLEKLVSIGRDAAANKLREYIETQDCQCEDCKKGMYLLNNWLLLANIFFLNTMIFMIFCQWNYLYVHVDAVRENRRLMISYILTLHAVIYAA